MTHLTKFRAHKLEMPSLCMKFKNLSKVISLKGPKIYCNLGDYILTVCEKLNCFCKIKLIVKLPMWNVVEIFVSKVISKF